MSALFTLSGRLSQLFKTILDGFFLQHGVFMIISKMYAEKNTVANKQ